MIRVIVFLIGAIVILGLSRSVYGLWRRGDVTHARKEELVRRQEENNALLQKLEEARSPSYVEQVAREKLGMVKEGEAIVIVPKTQNPEPNGQINTEEIPNWKKWWGLFF